MVCEHNVSLKLNKQIPIENMYCVIIVTAYNCDVDDIIFLKTARYVLMEVAIAFKSPQY